jgi:hypothetical protein
MDPFDFVFLSQLPELTPVITDPLYVRMRRGHRRAAHGGHGRSRGIDHRRSLRRYVLPPKRSAAPVMQVTSIPRTAVPVPSSRSTSRHRRLSRRTMSHLCGRVLVPCICPADIASARGWPLSALLQ